MARESFTHEQQELKLDDVRLRLPWGGRSPRVLTRGHSFSIFKAQAAKRTTDFDNDEQLELWPEPAEEGPEVLVYFGAPSLLPVRGFEP